MPAFVDSSFVISRPAASRSFPRTLIVESDPVVCQRIIAAIDRPCGIAPVESASSAEEPSAPLQRCDCTQRGGAFCWAAVDSIESITFLESTAEVIIGAASMLRQANGASPALPPQIARLIQRGATLLLTGQDQHPASALEAIRAGASEYVVTNESGLRDLPALIEKCQALAQVRLEGERRQRELEESVADLAFRNQELESVIGRLESLARTDELTGLTNRRWLNLMLEGAWAEATRHGFPLALMMIDLDGLKRLNDQAGHLIGDEVIRLAGNVIKANSRSVDTVARYGGDEFCLLLPHTRMEQAQQVAQRILRAFLFAASNRPAGEPRVSMSIGVAEIDASRPVNADALIRHADEALYAAKRAGKRCIRVRDRMASVLSGNRAASICA